MVTKPKILESAAQLQRDLEEALADNEKLVQKNEVLQRQIQDLEGRATVADERAVAAEKKRVTLESLAADEYKSVVTELFSEPSRDAAGHTKKWAIASIALGLTATLWSAWYSARSNSEAGSALTSVVEGRLTQHIENAAKKSSAALRESEERLAASFHQSIQAASAINNEVAAIIEVPRNGVVWRTVSFDHDIYFHVAIPSSTPRVDIKLFTITGDADLYVKYGDTPTPGTPETFVSSNSGTQLDSWYALPPAAGDWYLRVHGRARGHSYFAVQALY